MSNDLANEALIQISCLQDLLTKKINNLSERVHTLEHPAAPEPVATETDLEDMVQDMLSWSARGNIQAIQRHLGAMKEHTTRLKELVVYADMIFVALMPKDQPTADWKPLEDLPGLLSQLSNILRGIKDLTQGFVPKATEPKFKVGDRVIVHLYVGQPLYGTVISERKADGCYTVTDSADREWTDDWKEEGITLDPQQPVATEAKFKSGDKVRVTYGDYKTCTEKAWPTRRPSKS
jgi:transcription antitermination factor NusG